MEAGYSSEKSINVYHIIQRYFPEDNTQFEIISGHLSGGTEKNRENKLSTVDLRFDI
jgi:hypothetical protein